jgi:hypothetical protein
MSATHREPAPPLRLRWGVERIGEYLRIGRRCVQDLLNSGSIRSARMVVAVGWHLKRFLTPSSPTSPRLLNSISPARWVCARAKLDVVADTQYLMPSRYERKPKVSGHPRKGCHNMHGLEAAHAETAETRSR